MKEAAPLVEKNAPGLDGLVERLRLAGFPVGLSETLDAARLLQEMAKRGQHFTEQKSLKARLRPIFCKSSEAQRQFDSIFDAWVSRSVTSAQHSERASNTALESKRTQGANTNLNYKATQPLQHSPIFWLVVILALSLFASMIPYQYLKRPTSTTPSLPKIEVTPSEPATNAPNQLQFQTQTQSLSQSQSQPQPLAQHLGDKPKQLKQSGYPSLRYHEALQPIWAWLLLIFPLLGLLMLSALPRWNLSRTKGGQVRLDGWPHATTARLAIARLTPSIVGRLDRHLRGPGNKLRESSRRPQLDLYRTVRATLRRLGVPSLCYRYTRLRPTYLLLVDAPHDDDFAMLWAERLSNEGIETDLYRLLRDQKGQPFGWIKSIGQGVRRLALDALPTPAFGQRLVFLGDGACLVDATGRWVDWALRACFRRWPERALFTTVEPRNWGEREKILSQGESPSDTGFLVLPQDDNALAAWADLLVSGELPEITLSEPQRYPQLLARQPERFLDDIPPSLEDLDRLLVQLKTYLGENGYYWLSTCAVTPMIDHRLTLLLGAEFLERSGATEHRLPHYVARNYRLLTRLPWLSQGHMPDWLRLALLVSLPERIQDEVRRAVEGLLAPQRLNPQGELPLAFELPPRSKSPGSDAPAEGERDALYLGFMEGLNAHQLTLRMPGQWRKWLDSLSIAGSHSSYLRAWLIASISRFWYRRGLAHQGPGRARNLVAGTLVILSVIILVAVSLIPLEHWNMHLRAGLLEERTYVAVFRHQDTVKHAVFSPDGTRIITTNDDKTAQLRGATSGEPIGAPLYHESQINYAAFSPDGGRVITTSADKTTRLWGAIRGEPIGVPLRHEGAVNYVAFSPDGTRVITASDDKTAQLWGAASGEPIGVPLRHEGAVNYATFSPDGTRIITASDDKTARLWGAISGEPIGVPLRHEGAVNYATFSPDGTRIITASDDKSVRLWDAASGKSIGTPLNHEGAVNYATFSPDGTRIITASDDKTVRLWNTASGEPIGAPLYHESAVNYATFSPNGTQIITANEDKTVRLWNAANGHSLAAPMRHEVSQLQGFKRALGDLNSVYRAAPLLWLVLPLLVGLILWRYHNHRMNQRIALHGATRK